MTAMFSADQTDTLSCLCTTSLQSKVRNIAFRSQSPFPPVIIKQTKMSWAVKLMAENDTGLYKLHLQKHVYVP